jgi:Cd2+/Zn2+-exporting ATPase
MDCASCAQTVEMAVGALDGVTDAKVSFGNATLIVAGDVDSQALRKSVSRAGFRLVMPREHKRSLLRDPRMISTLAGALLLAFATALSLAGTRRMVVEPVYLGSMVVGGWPIAVAAWQGLRRRNLDMNVLMGLAAVGAVAIGAYSEGAWVLVLFAVGTGLETVAFDRSRRSVRALMDLTPKQVRILDSSGEHLVDVGDVLPGKTVVVLPGERLGLDGDVISGSSALDLSHLTGESFPVEKRAGDSVLAGAINGAGSLRILVTRTESESAIQKIAGLVDEAQGSRAPSERFVDTFARIYTPAVFVAAISLALIPIAFGQEPGTWIYRALALLIVACPCALVISIPVAVVSAVGRAARDGILFKGGQALEDLAGVRTFAFDKTGTLTEGSPRVADTRMLDNSSERETIRIAASLEARSAHPLGKAIVELAEVNGVEFEAVDSQTRAGLGVEGTVDGSDYWIGGPSLVNSRAISHIQAIEDAERRGRTVVALGHGPDVLAVFSVVDPLRQEAASAIRQVRGKAVMLTGDNKTGALRVAERLGIDRVFAGLLPEQKLETLRKIQQESDGQVAMVGDGINDAPALAAADVGIAMGATGADAAIEAADVALLTNDLTKLTEASDISARAKTIMKQNVVASLVVKAIFVTLTPFGLVSLVLAVIADMGMTLIVTMNGLRLLRSDESSKVRTGAELLARPGPGPAIAAEAESVKPSWNVPGWSHPTAEQPDRYWRASRPQSQHRRSSNRS